MAHELQFYGDPSSDSGLTVTARVYDGLGAQVGADVATLEVAASAIYLGHMPTAPAGTYGVRFFAGGMLLGSGTLGWDGVQEVEAVTLTQKVDDLHDFAGLGTAPLTETPQQRSVGTKAQTLSGDGVTTQTLTRTA